MKYYTTLYYTIIYYTTLYYTILYQNILQVVVSRWARAGVAQRVLDEARGFCRITRAAEMGHKYIYIYIYICLVVY